MPSRSDIDVRLGARVRRRRRELGLTQADLGRRLGLSFQQVQKYEAGRNRLGVATLLRIAEALETDSAYFLDGLSEEPSDD